MSYQREREDFIARMTQEGLPLHVTRLLLREATGINRRAELACSSEAADRDRVACPAATNPLTRIQRPCLCEDYGSKNGPSHGDVPRIAVQDWRAEERIRKALHSVNVLQNGGRTLNQEIPQPETEWDFDTQGDPRGYTLRVIPPSYAARNVGKDRFNRESIGVPAGPSRLRW